MSFQIQVCDHEIKQWKAIKGGLCKCPSYAGGDRKYHSKLTASSYMGEINSSMSNSSLESETRLAGEERLSQQQRRGLNTESKAEL
jgi:hypothetical protein